jgi:hypothetical protein
VPLPTSTKAGLDGGDGEGGDDREGMLFNRGNAMSGAPIGIGTNQFPNPPITAGITIKEVVGKA